MLNVNINESFLEETIKGIQKIVKIKSVRDEQSAKEGMPFGKGVSESIDCFFSSGDLSSNIYSIIQKNRMKKQLKAANRIMTD